MGKLTLNRQNSYSVERMMGEGRRQVTEYSAKHQVNDRRIFLTMPGTMKSNAILSGINERKTRSMRL